MIELSAVVQDLREGLRKARQRLPEANGRIDWLFLAVLAMGAAQIELLITLVIRNG